MYFLTFLCKCNTHPIHRCSSSDYTGCFSRQGIPANSCPRQSEYSCATSGPRRLSSATVRRTGMSFWFWGDCEQTVIPSQRQFWEGWRLSIPCRAREGGNAKGTARSQAEPGGGVFSPCTQRGRAHSQLSQQRHQLSDIQRRNPSWALLDLVKLYLRI